MFFIFRTGQVFTKLRQVFVEALILNHFNLEYDINIIIDVFGYTISRIFSQLTSDYLNQLYLVYFFSKNVSC